MTKRKTSNIALNLVLPVLAFALIAGKTFAGDDAEIYPIVDTVKSNINGITISINYDTVYANSDYKVQMHFEMAGSGKNTANNTSNTGFIEIGNTKEVINQFQIPQEKVCLVIKTKYNMGIYMRADFVFTNDSLYVISSSQMNSGAMTKITVYMLPRLGDKSDYQSYLAGNEIPGFEDFLLYRVVAFCDKHNINLNTD